MGLIVKADNLELYLSSATADSKAEVIKGSKDDIRSYVFIFGLSAIFALALGAYVRAVLAALLAALLLLWAVINLYQTIRISYNLHTINKVHSNDDTSAKLGILKATTVDDAKRLKLKYNTQSLIFGKIGIISLTIGSIT